MDKSSLQNLFPKDDISLLPIMFHFGELASQEQNNMEMGTRFVGEETISHPDGPLSFDTD